MDIKDRVTLISGGASGLGAATAEHLARLGARIVIIDHHVEIATTIAESVDGVAIACDVSDPKEVRAAVDRTVENYGAVHIVVNCAGIAPAARIVGRSGPMDTKDFERVIKVNLLGTFYVLQAATVQMMRQNPINRSGERGMVINTASTAAYEGQVGQAAYSASKGGVIALTLPAAREFGSAGIRVMAIAPGIMETPMMHGVAEEYAKKLANEVPFPKRLGLPDEYARLVAAIIENPYLNGSVIRLDGALRMPPK